MIGAPDEVTNRAIVRLIGNPDFQTFLHWLDGEKQAATTALLTSKDTVTVHQLQGETLVLVEIQQSVMAAPTVVAGKARAT